MVGELGGEGTGAAEKGTGGCLILIPIFIDEWPNFRSVFRTV
jgi:hypothetical protein